MATRRLGGDLHAGPRVFLHIPHASLSGIGAPTPQPPGGMKNEPSSWKHILFYQQGLEVSEEHPSSPLVVKEFSVSLVYPLLYT